MNAAFMLLMIWHGASLSWQVASLIPLLAFFAAFLALKFLFD